MATEQTFEADYLIIGAGAVAMAVADTLIHESDSSVIMVDQRHKPGGHWNDAYPFVRLHGPSANYGVNSRHLGEDRIDETGMNRGLYELATGSEICSYFDEVLRHELLPTGRLRYLPMHRYDGAGRAVSLTGGASKLVRARRKLIDATFAETQIPSRTPPRFDIASGARVIPPNELVRLDSPPPRFVLVGAGKTAIDTATWLLENGTDPAMITWIRPRDAWLLNRRTVQPTYEFFDQTYGWLTANMEAAASAKSVDDIFLHLEREGCMHRIDPAVVPTMYRCAIVSEQELEQLRRIKDVIRLGHVQGVEPGRVTLQQGEIEVPDGSLYVNCTAVGIPRKTPQPIFQPDRIVPQYVRMCSPTFSGALVAKVELMFDDDSQKNALTRPAPIPDKPADWIGIELNQGLNAAAWREHRELGRWLAESRLDQFTRMALRAVGEGDATKLQLLERYRQAVPAALRRMSEMVAEGAL